MTKLSRAGWSAAVLGAAFAASLVLANDSFAARRHVSLKKSSPAANDTLATSPKAISLWFNEKVELAVTTVKIADAKGVAASLGALKRDAAADAPVVADVTKPMAAGSYTLSWLVAGADGHPAKGTVTFVVKAAH